MRFFVDGKWRQVEPGNPLIVHLEQVDRMNIMAMPDDLQYYGTFSTEGTTPDERRAVMDDAKAANLMIDAGLDVAEQGPAEIPVSDKRAGPDQIRWQYIRISKDTPVSEDYDLPDEREWYLAEFDPAYPAGPSLVTYGIAVPEDKILERGIEVRRLRIPEGL